ncbi:STAS domain-containing protein [Streptomyces flavidovirens]|uniref:STAS domain-containing protein n=1 Tax=Streptomyces flavidovirens TaxID=67298 RepID=UPI0034457876
MVIELSDFIDSDNAPAVASELCRAVRQQRARKPVVVDVHTAGVASPSLDVLLRVQRTAHAHGVIMLVVARHPLTRKVFAITGLDRVLRVSTTMAVALHSSGGGCAAAGHRPANATSLGRRERRPAGGRTSQPFRLRPWFAL